MAAPSPNVLNESKVCVFELVEACVVQKSTNTTEIHSENASSSANRAPETNTNGHSDACESLMLEQVSLLMMCSIHNRLYVHLRLVYYSMHTSFEISWG